MQLGLAESREKRIGIGLKRWRMFVSQMHSRDRQELPENENMGPQLQSQCKCKGRSRRVEGTSGGTAWRKGGAEICGHS